jgi:hypothetical protein
VEDENRRWGVIDTRGEQSSRFSMGVCGVSRTENPCDSKPVKSPSEVNCFEINWSGELVTELERKSPLKREK